MKTYNVSIEQPMCKTVAIEAENIDEALEIARKQYNDGLIVITNDDLGTDAQIMAQEEGGDEESTEWTDL